MLTFGNGEPMLAGTIARADGTAATQMAGAGVTAAVVAVQSSEATVPNMTPAAHPSDARPARPTAGCFPERLARALLPVPGQQRRHGPPGCAQSLQGGSCRAGGHSTDPGGSGLSAVDTSCTGAFTPRSGTNST